jgi:uncharacterized membrane protein YiaA
MFMTKNFFIGLLIIVSFSNAKAQFSKRDKMVGASVASLLLNSGSSAITVENIGSNTSKITGYSVNLSPSVGWFFNENMAVGFTLTINPGGDKTTYEQSGSTYQSDKASRYNLGAGGFVRNYFGTSKKMRPFGQASINVGASSLNTDGFFYYNIGNPLYKHTYAGKSSGGFFLNAALTGGFTKMLSETTGLDFYLGYNFSVNNYTFKKTTLYYNSAVDTNPTRAVNNTTTKFTNNGVLAGIGFQVFIKGKKG